MAEWRVWRFGVGGSEHEVVMRLARLSGLVQVWVDREPRAAAYIAYSFDYDIRLGSHSAKASVLYGRGPACRLELDGERLPPTDTHTPPYAKELLANAPEPAKPTYVRTGWDNVPLYLAIFLPQLGKFDGLIVLVLCGVAAWLATKELGSATHPLVPALGTLGGYYSWLVLLALYVPGAWPFFVVGAIGLFLSSLVAARRSWWPTIAITIFNAALVSTLAWLDQLRAAIGPFLLLNLAMALVSTALLVQGMRKLRGAEPSPASSTP